ncbi:MAG: hypothetical protein ACTHJM_16285 [Marmoricola sp.]
MSILQVKNIPDELHAKLAERAKAQHTTMSKYVIDLIWRDLSRPTMADLFAEIEADLATQPPVTRADILRALDEARAEDDPDERFDGLRR